MSDIGLMVVDPPRRARVPKAVRILVGLAVSGWLGFLLLTGVLLVAKRTDEGLASGGNGAPRLLVGPVIVAEPWVETALPIQLGPAKAVPRDG